MRIIAAAQAEARALMVSPGQAVPGEIEIGQAIDQRIQFQEAKRLSNTEAVVQHAALALGDGEVPNTEPNHDWTARFFNEVQDVSSDEMQELWAKVLAGEIQRPGSVSLLTLDVLRNLDQRTAQLFTRLCSACIAVKLGIHTIDARVPSLSGTAGNNSLGKFGLEFGNLNRLNEHGLIISDYNSWYDYRLSIMSSQQQPLLPFTFQNKGWVFSPIGQWQPREFKVHGVALTASGVELSRIVGIETMDNYMEDFKGFLATQNLRLVEVENWDPAILEPSVDSGAPP